MESREFFERAMQDHLPPMGATKATVEGVKEFVTDMYPGLSLSKMLKEMGPS